MAEILRDGYVGRLPFTGGRCALGESVKKIVKLTLRHVFILIVKL